MASQVGEKPFELLLGQATGYGIVVGLGAAFTILMLGFTYLQKKYTRFDVSSASEFATASRSIKPGLICAGIVSAWTWSATLLQSSTATYQSGLSAAWWYAVGGTTQIGFFAAIAAKVKQNANGATTFLQIARARYGTPCHILFTCYALICAHCVAGSLILGASATINGLTGMSVYACNFLLPVGISFYVIAGGLRATFICDFTHTVILFVIIFMFMFSAFTTSDIVGSPSKVYELLKQAAITTPVDGNAEGSYLTMKSNGGLLFGGILVASGASGVFCDQGYWQRAIASRPESTTKAYMLGGLSWFAIPWAFGTTMGLVARATESNPSFPTYPYPLSASQQSAGLVAPASAVVLLGKGGAAAVLVLTFMAATSAASAELIAVSSIVVYDIIGTYLRPLTGRQVVIASHATIAFFGIWFGAWASILHSVKIDLGWLFYVQGTVLTPSVVPIGLTVCWSKMSRIAAFYGTLTGAVCGLAAWFVGCYKIYGHIGVDTLPMPYVSICGSATGLTVSAIATIILALIFPAKDDWTKTRAIRQASDNKSSRITSDGTTTEDPSPILTSSLPSSQPIIEDVEKAKMRDEPSPNSHIAEVQPASTGQVTSEMLDGMEDEEEIDPVMLNKVFKKAAWYSLTLALIVGFLVPIPQFAANYIMSKPFFTFWIAVAFIWVFISGTFCIFLPIWESRRELDFIVRHALGYRKTD